MQTTKEKIREFLLKLADKSYNIRWVQAQPKFEGGKRYLQFYNTQDLDSDLGRIEIKEALTHYQASDLVREVKYPLLDPKVLEHHLKGMRNVESQRYSKYKTFYENIIMNYIDLESYDVHDEFMNDYEKVRKVFIIFREEYVHHYNRYQDMKKLFASWLQGLPTVLTVPFMYHDILKNAKEYGYEFSSEKSEDEFLQGYWDKLAHAFFTLKDNL